jgi:phenylpropionate dioxygenase-like ring-hydroxylating dioxygenase large terminal subunit
MSDSILTPALLASFDDSIESFEVSTTIDPAVYTAPEFFEFEKEAVFGHEWLCVGRSERIPNPGDWFTVTLVDEPLVVTRDKAGTVRCLSAVCQHRAMQVCEGEGNSTTLKCPYHHWNYALDGRLLGAPAMERTRTSTRPTTASHSSSSRSGRDSSSSTSTPRPPHSAPP